MGGLICQAVEGQHRLKVREHEAGEDDVEEGSEAYRAELRPLLRQKNIWVEMGAKMCDAVGFVTKQGSQEGP